MDIMFYAARLLRHRKDFEISRGSLCLKTEALKRLLRASQTRRSVLIDELLIIGQTHREGFLLPRGRLLQQVQAKLSFKCFPANVESV
jgi:hypothetical protein